MFCDAKPDTENFTVLSLVHHVASSTARGDVLRFGDQLMPMDNTLLAAAVHRLADQLIEKSLTNDVRLEALDALDRLSEKIDRLQDRSLESRSERFITQMSSRNADTPIDEGEEFISFDASPYSGSQNALAPRQVTYTRVGDTVAATVLLGTALEGRPGRAHGGAVAAVFDDVMGALQHVIKRNGYTRTLTTTYLAPFPTDQPVDVTEIDVERWRKG